MPIHIRHGWRRRGGGYRILYLFSFDCTVCCTSMALVFDGGDNGVGGADGAFGKCNVAKKNNWCSQARVHNYNGMLGIDIEYSLH